MQIAPKCRFLRMNHKHEYHASKKHLHTLHTIQNQLNAIITNVLYMSRYEFVLVKVCCIF